MAIRQVFMGRTCVLKTTKGILCFMSSLDSHQSQPSSEKVKKFLEQMQNERSHQEKHGTITATASPAGLMSLISQRLALLSMIQGYKGQAHGTSIPFRATWLYWDMQLSQIAQTITSSNVFKIPAISVHAYPLIVGLPQHLLPFGSARSGLYPTTFGLEHYFEHAISKCLTSLEAISPPIQSSKPRNVLSFPPVMFCSFTPASLVKMAAIPSLP